MSNFRSLTLSGSPHERGLAHGETLRQEIRGAMDYYREIFRLPEDTILSLAREFGARIDAFDPALCEEIEGIATGTGVDVRWIVALNARTEILSRGAAVPAQECTALYFRSTRLLGQNWDWAETLEPLVAVARIEFPDGHVITTLTEPGMLAKIGLNAAGLGVCLNILSLPRRLDGLPVHVLLRAILECRSIDEAQHLVAQHGAGKASNLLVANDRGEAFDAELDGDAAQWLNTDSEITLHTNHYLCRPLNAPEDPLFASSYARAERVGALASRRTASDRETMIRWLSDHHNIDYPILRDYVPDEGLGKLGTVCTIIMDLARRSLSIRRGPNEDGAFSEHFAA